GDAGRNQRVELVAQDAEPEVRQEQHDQKWRALDELDVAPGDPAQPRRPGDAHQRDRQADDGAAREGDHRQEDRPTARLYEVEQMVEAELDHGDVLTGASPAGGGARTGSGRSPRSPGGRAPTARGRPRPR